MPSSQFLAPITEYTPYRATLTSFGSAADGKAVKRTPFTLEATSNGSSWSTIDSDWYYVRRKTGYVEFRDVDDGGSDVDIDAYIAYQDLGNQAFRVTYTVKNGSSSTTYTTEAMTFALADPYVSVSDDGSVGGELAQNLWVPEIHADFGDIGGWYLSTTQIISDSGNVFLDSSVPAIGLGATGYQTGTGFWVGKSGGAYKLYLGDSSNKQMYWDGSALTAGGFTIGADYLRDAANTFGLASTVTGGDDVRFWAGDSFANRASASLQLYESGYIFAKDIVLAKGSLTGASGNNGYGYAVDPLLLSHFDGARPFETDFRGSAIGHKGQPDTRTGGVVFYEGKFNKAIAIAEGTTTNLIVNPSFETSGTANWSTIGTWATNAQSTEQSKFGGNSCKLVNSSGAIAYKYASFTATATTSTISLWVYLASGSGTITLKLQEGFGSNTIISNVDATSTTGVWQRLVVSGATSIGSVYWLILNSTAAGNTLYIDGAQAESTAYVTPYFDGSFTATYNLVGYAWTGTAHASTSTRAAATLTYDAAGNINLAQGSISFWYYANASIPTNAYAFGARIDANNYLRINLASAGANKPNAGSASGGSAVDTTSGVSTASSSAWHHVCVTWTTGALKLYLDGTQSGATATYAIPAGTLSTIELGSFNSTTQSDTRIDDFCILPIVLTDHEIKSIYYSDAPLMLAVNSQELRLSGAGLGDVFGNANGLFARGADGIASFGLLNGTVNATTWGGDSESFASGDFMFGGNASGQSNIKYDASLGVLSLRSAQTNRITLGGLGSVFTGVLAITSGATTVTNGVTDLDVGVAGGVLHSYFRITSSTGNFSIRGIATPTDDGTILFLDYQGSNNMTFTHNGGAPAGYSDIHTGDGTSPLSGGQGWGLFIYNQNLDRWRLIAHKT